MWVNAVIFLIIKEWRYLTIFLDLFLSLIILLLFILKSERCSYYLLSLCSNCWWYYTFWWDFQGGKESQRKGSNWPYVQRPWWRFKRLPPCLTSLLANCSLLHIPWKRKRKTPKSMDIYNPFLNLQFAAQEIYDLWMEYEEGSSPEAKLVKDFDKVC